MPYSSRIRVMCFKTLMLYLFCPVLYTLIVTEVIWQLLPNMTANSYLGIFSQRQSTLLFKRETCLSDWLCFSQSAMWLDGASVAWRLPSSGFVAQRIEAHSLTLAHSSASSEDGGDWSGRWSVSLTSRWRAVSCWDLSVGGTVRCEGFCGLVVNPGVCPVRFSTLKCLPGQSREY